jgi:hypothetical protein
MLHTVGAGQRSRRQPLDATAPLPWGVVGGPGASPRPASAGSGGPGAPPEPLVELSYAALARQSKQRAADAVDKWVGP